MTREEQMWAAVEQEHGELSRRESLVTLTAMEWADKTMLDKACKWLKERVTFPYEGGCDENGNPLAMDYIEWCEKVNENSDLFIKKFKEAMEE